MHQDYASTRCHNALRGWVPLTRVDEERGTMRVVIGSHKLGYLDHDTSDPRYPRVSPALYQHLPAQTLTGEPGDLVLFHPTLLHESVPNRSLFVKFVLLLHLQDLATMSDPDDPDEPMRIWIESAGTRESTRLGQGTSRH